MIFWCMDDSLASIAVIEKVLHHVDVDHHDTGKSEAMNA